MLDSADPSPVSGRSRSKEIIRDRPVWTAYWSARAKFMAPRTSQPTTPIETAVFKQAGKINAKNKDKGLHSDDDEEPRRPNTGGHKKSPPKVKMVNMIYATHIPKREQKQALQDVYGMEPVAPKFNPWSACPITFDRRDHPTSIPYGGSAALVLDPIIDGFHLTRVLMDGGNDLFSTSYV